MDFLRPPYTLTKAFNSAACLVSDTHKFSRLTLTLISLDWLPFKKISVFKICTLMFEIKDNHSPNYLADLFKLPPRKELRSTNSHFFGIPSNSTYATSTLFYCELLLWNSLCPNLTSIASLLSFRKAFKNLLYKQFEAECS